MVTKSQFSDTNQDSHYLKQDEAIELWRQGKDAWNSWVEEHPVADIIFEGVDFQSMRGELPHRIVSFEGFKFPKGEIRFTNCNFQGGLTHFTFIEFGHGDVLFDFSDFGEEQTLFYESKFGDGKASFANVHFGDGGVSFTKVNFGDGKVNFFNSRFGDGPIFFNDTVFGEGDVSFLDVAFGEGNLDFSNALLGKGDYSFERVVFGCNVNFSSIPNSEKLKSLSFRYSVFEKTLDITKSSFDTVIDLTHTKMANQVLLDGLTCKLHRKRNRFGLVKKSSDSRAVEKLRRLKEISEDNRDNHQALYFFSEEMRAKRWVESGGLSSTIDFLYSALCNYGQSIKRPIFMLAVALISITTVIAMTTAPASSQYDITERIKNANWLSAAEYTVINSFPVIPNAKNVRADSFSELFCRDILFIESVELLCVKPWWLNFLTVAQGLISFGLIFLIGLGFRNRFRV